MATSIKAVDVGANQSRVEVEAAKCHKNKIQSRKNQYNAIKSKCSCPLGALQALIEI